MRLRVLTVLVLLGMLVPATAVPQAAHAGGGLPKLLGMASADYSREFPQFASQAGRGLAFMQLFWRLDASNTFDPAQRLSRLHDLGVTGYVELQTTTASTIDTIAAGRGDHAVDRFIDSAGPWLRGAQDRHLLVAPFPEANLTQHPWGGDPAAYRAAYRRIVQRFRDRGLGPDRVRFVFAMNGISSPGLGYAQFWPGDGYADLQGFSKINRGDPWRDYRETFVRHIDEMRASIGTRLPIIITQTGSVTRGGDRATWLRDMFAGLRDHPDVIGAIYFNRTKPEECSWCDYRVLVDGSLDSRVRDGYRTWSPPSEAAWIFDGGLDAWLRAGRVAPPGIELVGDWDGDGIDTPGWWADGRVTLRNSPFGRDITYAYGTRGDIPLVGDWNGDGIDTLAIIRDGEWHLRNRHSSGPGEITFTYGRISRGDHPIAGDWNGDGIDTVGIIRDGEWHLRNRHAGGRADIVFLYGRILRGDLPLVGDWNGDGIDTAGIVRDGEWHLIDTHRNGAADRSFVYGRILAGDRPLSGDWNGDDISTPAIVRAQDWYLRLRNKGGAADIVWDYE